MRSMNGLATVSTAHWKRVIGFLFVLKKIILNLERVEEVLGEVHGVLHPLHQQVGGVHGQVGQGVVTLSQICLQIFPK